MLHSKHITVLANTTEAAPNITRFRVNQGVIHTVWLTFPAGCVGLVKLRIFHEGHPFLPVEIDAYISGENFTFAFPVMYEITEPPEQITIQAWNEDELYQHKIDILFLIVDKSWIQPVGAYEGIVKALSSIFTRKTR